MNKETLKALKKSIEKWEKIVKREGEDRGLRNKALCRLFLMKGCKGCPVYSRTGKISCEGTPYIEWIKHHRDKHPSILDVSLKIKCPKCKELALQELEFLKSLLSEREELNKTNAKSKKD